MPGWRHVGAAFEMIDVGRRSVGAHFGGAKYAHVLLGFLLFARSEEIDANLIQPLAPRVGYPRDEEMPERSSGWGRKFEEPIALPGGGSLVPRPPPRS
ncbi:hypothetical protein CP49_23715 [Bradyrhizobium valentinum]|uniref:Uncharacterized protein n=1 Tax=Bradyrhizobium valentinum TaxID=1518501 RepID=A0A0R3L8E2_9BRAD|nr:hypothetical protein CP49_23715 [Bradyrhizobium valentinum]